MKLIFIDDSVQRDPPRRDLGELVALGAVIVPGDQVAGFAADMDAIKERLGVPADEELKWKPAKGSFLARAGGPLVVELRKSVLEAAIARGITSVVHVLDHSRVYNERTVVEVGQELLKWSYDKVAWDLDSDGAVMIAPTTWTPDADHAGRIPPPARPPGPRRRGEWLSSKGTDQYRGGLDMAQVHANIDHEFDSYPFVGWLVDGQVVAMMALIAPEAEAEFWSPEELAEPQIYISRFFVAEHGRGHGSDLLEAVIEGARQQGKRWVRLNCWSTNTKLHDYYVAHGFEHVRTCNVRGRMSGALFQRRTDGLEQGVGNE